MSANQSNLSDPHYGYDFVVATTQESINAAMKQYLYDTTFPTIKMYWNQDANGNPVPVTYAELMTQTNNTDPLNVPSWSPPDPMSPDIENINNSNFYFAFEAAIGIPPDIDPQDIPDIISLQSASQSVYFSLISATFTIVMCNFGRHGLTNFLNVSQPTDTPWVFNSIVPLKNIINNTSLPPAVQAALNNFGPDAFSVQQLLFDLDNAALESVPTITGVPPGSVAYTLLSEVFLGAYFNIVKQQGAPVLGYTIVKNNQVPLPSTLTITNMELEVSPYNSPSIHLTAISNLDTLNYLCAINGNVLPPPVPFAWNWIEQSEESSASGVIAIKRINFLNFLNTLFSQDLGELNITTNVSMWHDGEDMYSQWGFTGGGSAGQAFTVLPQAQISGFTPVMTYSLSNTSTDDTHDATHTLKMNGEFDYSADVEVAVNGSVIQVTTHVVSYLHFWYGGYYGGQIAEVGGNVVDYTSTVQYTMSVTQNGALKVDMQQLPFQDNSQDLDVSTWDKMIIGNIVDTMNDIKNQLQPIVKNAMSTYNNEIESSANGYRSWVFPGGNSFTFQDVSFSNNQDLVSHISYVQQFI